MNAEKKEEETTVQHKRGFSLIEVLVAMAITLVILAAAFGVFKSMSDSSTAANQVYEVTTDAQAALNLIRRDLQRAVDIPGSGIPVPVSNSARWGKLHCTRNVDVVVDNNTKFICESSQTIIPPIGRNDLSSGYVLDAVTPITVTVAENTAEGITILYYDEFARDIDAIVSTSNTLSPINHFDAKFEAIRSDDFIFLHNGPGPILQQVTQTLRDDGNIRAILGVNDTSGINNSLAEGDVRISLLRRVTYYLNEGSDGRTWLMRQVNNRPAERLVTGVASIDLSYNTLDDDGKLDLDVHRNTLFFDYDAGRIRDIRRVNVDIRLDSETPGTSGSQKTVKSTQIAKMAVRRLSSGSCPCDEEWNDVLDACMPKGNGGLGCDADNNEFWDVDFEICNVCPNFMQPTRCGCVRRCPSLDQYWDDLKGECVDWKPAPVCTYTGSCDSMNCLLDGCSGDGDGGKYTCTVSFFDASGNPITSFARSKDTKRWPPGMPLPKATYLSPSAYSNANGGTLQIGNPVNKELFQNSHRFNANGVTVAYMQYSDGNGDKSPITPIKLSGVCTSGLSAIHCPSYYDDACMGACRFYFEDPANAAHCNSITTCRLGGVCSEN